MPDTTLRQLKLLECIPRFPFKKTPQEIKEVLENEGFEYGILHKSSFLGVDDAKFHALKSEFEDAHYALNDAVGIEYTRTATKAFVPM